MNAWKTCRAFPSAKKTVAGPFCCLFAVLWIGLVLPARALTLTPSPTPLPSVWNVEKVGQIGGDSYAVAVEGDYAYVGEGANIAILNILNPSSPKVQSQIALPDFPQSIALSGGLAYVADSYAGLQIVDVSNPASPFPRGSHDMSWNAWGVAVSGGLAYVADEKGGVYILRYTGEVPPTPANCVWLLR